MVVVGPERGLGGGIAEAWDRTRDSLGQRVINVAVTVIAIAVVVACLANPALIFVLIGIWIGTAGAMRALARVDLARTHPRASLAASLALSAIVIAAYGPELLAIILVSIAGVIGFGLSLVAGVAAGGSALAAPATLWPLSVTAPIVAGVASGVVMAGVHRVRRLRISRRAQDSLVAGALSREAALSPADLFAGFVTNTLAAYVVAGLLDGLGAFQGSAAGIHDAAMRLSGVAGGGGFAGGGGSTDIAGLALLLLALLGALVGFGLIVGLIAGAPTGGMLGLIQWTRTVEGAAAAVTLEVLEHRPGAARRFRRGLLRGAADGMITGGVVSVSLGGLRVAGLL